MSLTLQVGSVLDNKYRLDAFISHGGMGSVYRATHVMLGRTVAVKVIKPELVTSPDVVRRFQREARAATALNHPNIVSVYDLDQSPDGTLYLAMEFIDGPSLKDEILGKPPMPAARVIHLLRQVASALGAAHRHGIVHRDLKPQNIMLAPAEGGSATAKLVDFGIAKTFDEVTELTMSGHVLGTPHYMAPEQAEGKAVDGRTDLYSLGVILYEILTGELPFGGTTTTAVVLKHLKETPVQPSVKKPGAGISPALEAIAMRCLEKEPAMRFANAEELSRALDLAGSVPSAGAASQDTLPAGSAAAFELPTIPAARRTPADTRPTAPAIPTGSEPTLVVPAAAPQPPATAPQGALHVTAPGAARPVTPTIAPPPPAPPPVSASVAPQPAVPSLPPPATAAGRNRSGMIIAAAAALVVVLAAGAIVVFMQPGDPRPAAVAATTPTEPPTAAPATALPPTAAEPTAPAASVGGAPAARTSDPPGSDDRPPPAVSASPRTTERVPSAETVQPVPAPSASAAAQPPPARNEPTPAPASQPTPAPASPPAPATAAQMPANPAVFFQCTGAQEICSALRTEVQDALDRGGMSIVRAADRADIVVTAAVDGVEQRVSQQFGTTFAVRNYSIELDAESRAGETVAMGPSSSVSFDPQFGSERVTERARLVAAEVVTRIQAFVKRKRG